ncbi:hypothetical protein [Reticulibacter mediterranei]|uniref:hypothetical protein n=1 Tax=Reticulibacter mediterranei TaxID=2778369 RepID=UPI001C68FEBB|nr:hypothetical protein [Reticulibacter mediterranei]
MYTYYHLPSRPEVCFLDGYESSQAFPCGSRTPQRLRRFVGVEEEMVAGGRLCLQPPSPPQPARRVAASIAGRSRREKIRDDS